MSCTFQKSSLGSRMTGRLVGLKTPLLSERDLGSSTGTNHVSHAWVSYAMPSFSILQQASNVSMSQSPNLCYPPSLLLLPHCVPESSRTPAAAMAWTWTSLTASALPVRTIHHLHNRRVPRLARPRVPHTSQRAVDRCMIDVVTLLAVLVRILRWACLRWQRQDLPLLAAGVEVEALHPVSSYPPIE